MRIVYDDTKQKEAIKLIHDYLMFTHKHQLTDRRFCRWSYGMNRVEGYKVKECINGMLEDYRFSLGKDISTSSIGNNRQYPIYYDGNDNEMQLCGYLNLTVGLYGEAYVSVSDFKDKVVSNRYKIYAGLGGISIQ